MLLTQPPEAGGPGASGAACGRSCPTAGLGSTGSVEQVRKAIMSLDIFFQPCRFTGSPVVGNNPFTGEAQSFLPDEPLRAAELKAVQQVLKRAKAHGPDAEGCYVVRLDDGGEAEIFGRELETGCM